MTSEQFYISNSIRRERSKKYDKKEFKCYLKWFTKLSKYHYNPNFFKPYDQTILNQQLTICKIY